MWRWERREKKLKSKRQKMPKHGKAVGEMYASGINRDLQKANSRRTPKND